MMLRVDSFVSTSLPGYLYFETSGTTGRPVTWWRSRRQVLTEAGMLIDMLGLREVDHILTYAPTVHLYGFLFGSVIPALLDVPVTVVDLKAPLPSRGEHPLLVTLPASWWHLDRSEPALASFSRITAVHSSAAMPPGATHVARAWPHMTLTEIHGSTETGMIGTRRRGSGEDWTLAPDVEFADDAAPGAEGRLHIRSPRTGWQCYDAKSPEIVLGDCVRFLGPDSYRLVGRHNRLVKVNGRRVNLEWVEARLHGSLPGLPMRCRPVRDDVRGEWFDVVIGDGGDTSAVADVCRRVLRPWEVPREILCAKVNDDD